MARQRLGLRDSEAILRKYARLSGWNLCVGAGVSVGPFESWDRLCEQLLETIPTKSGEVFSARQALSLMTNEAAIQAFRETMRLDEDEFRKALSEVLYRNFRKAVPPRRWPLMVDALSAEKPGDLSARNWQQFVDELLKRFPDFTGHLLARVIVRSINKGVGPSAIVTFNVEPLFLALLNAYVSILSRGKKKEPMFDRIVRSISCRKSGRIPFFFCHGLFAIPGARGDNADAAAWDKIVFAESDFMQVTDAGFSWQALTFQSCCVSRPTVFYGLSFTDPNLRRWLHWLQNNRQSELRAVLRGSSEPTAHIWLTQSLASETVRRFVEASVEHLGVRVGWLQSWKSVERDLGRLLGLGQPPVPSAQ
jgi:hypothetical protein